ELYMNQERLASQDRREANPAFVRTGIVALLPERFADDPGLACFLRHELTHLHDMVDPAFGYSPELHLAGHLAAQERFTRQRYRLLWDITIAGRLERSDTQTQRTRESQRSSFDRAYSFWPESKRRQVFDELWTGLAPRHTR